MPFDQTTIGIAVVVLLVVAATARKVIATVILAGIVLIWAWFSGVTSGIAPAISPVLAELGRFPWTQ